VSEEDDQEAPARGLPEIDIPDSAKQVKAWFPERPSDDVVEEVLSFVADED
jgi:hypothetical protein